MKKRTVKPITFEAVTLAEPVDKVLWDNALDIIARLIVKQCKEEEQLAKTSEKGKCD